MAEVADYLRVHPSTIYRMLRKQQIPAFRVGSDYRFNQESIDRWRLGVEVTVKSARKIQEGKQS
jgi:excisionase family DNA binding protein